MTRKDLKDTAALITGASRGLGRALAKRLAAKGVRVVLLARNPSEVAQVEAEIRQAGGTAFAIAADVGDKQAVHRIAGEAAALAGPIDLLINNASTLGPTPLPLLLDTECEELASVLEVNLIGPFRLTKLIAGSMALRGGGTVVNVSSDAGVQAYPRWGAYGVSKAALDHLTRIFAVELEESGVRFFAVDPGEMNTRMHAEAIPDADPATLADPADIAARIVAFVEGAAQGVAKGVDEAKSGQRLAASDMKLEAVAS
jgi:NAD(P)-dependent dehydrogenase (short-subunit alcohol dehydrogenase family)